MTRPKLFTFAVVALLFGFGGAVVTIGARNFIRMRSQKASNLCTMNLVTIDSAKESLAVEGHKPKGYHPTWRDLQPFLGRDLACPEGGTYDLGQIGELPTCSLGGPGHSLPKGYGK